MRVHKVSLRFTRQDKPSSEDDILDIFSDERHRGMYRIHYITPHVPEVKNRFYMNEKDTINHVSEILKSLENDADPFEYVQVMSWIQPSVMYHVFDLEDRNIRWQLEDAILAAMIRPVKKIEQ